jgi:HK97 gp10 family phage protein
MTYNPSVARFKKDMLDIVNRAKQDYRKTLVKQAEELAENIREAAPKRTGTLRQSVRVRDISTETKVSVLVFAGGPLTTKRTANTVYDYAVGTEFGTQKENPEPYFYNTYRLYKNEGLAQIHETFDQVIEQNNQMRAARSEGLISYGSYTGGKAGSVTVSHGGAYLRNLKL